MNQKHLHINLVRLMTAYKRKKVQNIGKQYQSTKIWNLNKENY